VTPENIQLKIQPNNYRDAVYSIEMIDTSKILGFNTYNNILAQSQEANLDDRNSDFYNVTLNLVVKRMSQYEAD